MNKLMLVPVHNNPPSRANHQTNPDWISSLQNSKFVDQYSIFILRNAIQRTQIKLIRQMITVLPFRLRRQGVTLQKTMELLRSFTAVLRSFTGPSPDVHRTFTGPPPRNSLLSKKIRPLIHMNFYVFLVVRLPLHAERIKIPV
jgi:hypothetical protein